MLWDPFADFQSATLPNGLTVYASTWEGRPWEAVGFLIHSGAEHDPAGIEGTAHFVEHLVSRNASMPYEDIKTFFEGSGGGVGLGQTGYPFTKYKFFAPANREILEKAFSVFGGMLLSATLEKEIGEQRQVITREFQQKCSNRHRFDMTMRGRRTLFRNTMLERSALPLGSLESIGKISREDLQSYYDSHYTPANISIVGVGGMTLAELVDILSETPFVIQKNGIRMPLPSSITATGRPLEENRYVFNNTQKELGELSAGDYASFALLPGNIKYGVVGVFNDMLDKALFREIRGKRSWTYSASSENHYLRSFYSLSIFCQALSREVLDEIEGVVERCIISTIEDTNLFLQTKQYILSSLLDLNGRKVRDSALNDLASYQRLISYSEHRERIDLVTMEDIQGLAPCLLPEQRWTLIVRP